MLIEGERGKPGRQEIDHECNPDINVEGIDGAWVEREVAGKRTQRQLAPVESESGIYPTAASAFPRGYVLGVRRKDLDDLAENLKAQMPPKSAKDLDKPLKERERATLLTIIAALAE